MKMKIILNITTKYAAKGFATGVTNEPTAEPN
jgi:hypothetical protein